jgi:hypothetical protein
VTGSLEERVHQREEREECERRRKAGLQRMERRLVEELRKQSISDRHRKVLRKALGAVQEGRADDCLSILEENAS